MEAGTQIHAGDVELPEGVTLHEDPDGLVVNVAVAPTAEEIEADLAQSEADLGVVHEQPADEAASAAQAEAAGVSDGAAASDAEDSGEAAQA